MPSNQVLEHVAANLRRLRDGQGLSQQALADAAGVSRRTTRPWRPATPTSAWPSSASSPRRWAPTSPPWSARPAARPIRRPTC